MVSTCVLVMKKSERYTVSIPLINDCNLNAISRLDVLEVRSRIDALSSSALSKIQKIYKRRDASISASNDQDPVWRGKTQAIKILEAHCDKYQSKNKQEQYEDLRAEDEAQLGQAQVHTQTNRLGGD
jgi:hypothetical protein